MMVAVAQRMITQSPKLSPKVAKGGLQKREVNNDQQRCTLPQDGQIEPLVDEGPMGNGSSIGTINYRP